MERSRHGGERLFSDPDVVAVKGPLGVFRSYDRFLFGERVSRYQYTVMPSASSVGSSTFITNLDANK